MSIYTSAVISGLTGLGFALGFWTREKETDSTGHLCVRYCGFRYVMPLTAAFWIGAGLYHLNDPEYLCHPENFYVVGGVIGITLLASIYFVLFRVTLREGTIERFQWPLKTLSYSVDELSFIGKKGSTTVLHFGEGRTLMIPIFLSGQSAFIEKLQALLVDRVAARMSSHSRGPGRRR